METGEIHTNEILTSPLSHAYDTAQEISSIINVPLRIEPRLIEQNFGRQESTPRDGQDFAEARNELCRHQVDKSLRFCYSKYLKRRYYTRLMILNDPEHTHIHEGGTAAAHAHGHKHSHTHDPKEIRAIINRLSKSIGHLESVRRMLENGEDCADVLIQIAAVRSEINNAGKLLLKEHLEHCIVEAVAENDQESIQKMNEAIDKFMK